MRSDTIEVFEHQRLEIGRRYSCGDSQPIEFEQRHYDALAAFNDRHGSQYFVLGRRSIEATSYVGVVQVGRLGIEILPKVDQAPNGKHSWRAALVRMLLATRRLAIRTPDRASLDSEQANLLSVFVDAFLTGVARLCHEGLTRRYRTTHSNVTAFRGRLLVAENVRRNLVHAERFFIEHQAYDYRHLLHRILWQAMNVLLRADLDSEMSARLYGLMSWFPKQDRHPVSREELSDISLDRNTERYRDVLVLARLILLHASPTVRSGGEDVLALLFDMNVLFEEFVGLQCQRLELPDATVRLQCQKPFWPDKPVHRRALKPDVVVIKRSNGKNVVLDCKWKVPRQTGPSVEDLRQIFAYNQYYGSREGILLYPAESDAKDAIAGCYVGSDHGCRVAYLSLFKNGEFSIDHIRAQLHQLVATTESTRQDI